ncbi:hypothetical protein NDA11_005650 [Ustilago hordei]|uniref:Wax synthase domain-containing protein n=1 Tax=Ustilago hordei TaxID=120017 RepID=I2FXZ2_USTHO|nr:hypothetical protein NDA10_007988 [Ustilago hordei]KAJ1570922.1 hypothetical protein NDA11_005650 [Ustilago hordei]KAJ1587666.1 hypothetical protein NDA15_007422 [Ustilago hordei]KAJ1589807.1 hypothetical protein NDA12_001123 [Ustilago hordei]KAJ1602367.1 hypothetical protein NDA14_004575 [Ustilago hordei]
MISALTRTDSWSSTLHSLHKWAIPDFYDKMPYDHTNSWIIAAPMPFILLQIHLLIRYDPKTTLLLRASLIPIVVLLSLRSTFAYYYKLTGQGQLDGRGQHVNITLGCGAFCIIIWSLGWGLTLQPPRLKVAPSTTNGTKNRLHNRQLSKGKAKAESDLPTFFPGTKMPVELDLLLNLRGIGWEYGIKQGAPALPVPQVTIQQRLSWIVRHLAEVPVYYLLYDAILILVEDQRFNPHAHTRYGGSIWDCRKGSFGAAGPYLICAAYASSFICVQAMMHAVLGAISIGFLNDLPSRWDPQAVQVPWLSTSVHQLWGKRWHQYLRVTFMTLGFWPVRDTLKPIAGRRVANIAGIWGTFLASSFVHEFGRVNLAPKPGFCVTHVSLFFAIQPIAIFAEQGWEKVTGRKVRGLLGWLWTMTWMLSTSPLLMEVSAAITTQTILLKDTHTDSFPLISFQMMNRDGMLASKNMTLAVTKRPVTLMLDWWDNVVRGL